MKNYYISPDASLIECMRIMDRAGSGIALAVDSELRLVGTVSDGDIRKAFSVARGTLHHERFF